MLVARPRMKSITLASRSCPHSWRIRHCLLSHFHPEKVSDPHEVLRLEHVRLSPPQSLCLKKVQ